MKHNALWTLSELVAEVAAQLARNYESSGNGQVRAVPDERAIRYYTHLGLVDRPAAMRGRTALYGRRHLAQLVAIKRLQSRDKPLSEIQKLLPTLDDETLARIAGVTLSVLERTERTEREAFWRAPSVTAVHEPMAAQRATAPPASMTRFDAVWNLTLARGVTLTLHALRSPTEADADAVLSAAQGLCAELERRGLIAEQDLGEAK